MREREMKDGEELHFKGRRVGVNVNEKRERRGRNDYV